MHRLDPLLRPRSIALVGASTRIGTVGETLTRQLVQGGFTGRAFPVNPRYDEVAGLPCYASIAALPQPVDHVVLAVADERVETVLQEALAHGVRAATIFSSLLEEPERRPSLAARVRDLARVHDAVICGAMSMGFYNFDESLWVCGFDTRRDHRAGGVSLITQSGSVLSSLVDAEARIDYNLVVSSGQELTTTAADYLDFALDLASTRVVGLFLETVRDPRGFVASLEKARARAIPVVVLKVGRTQASARLAQSHSGALVGNDGAYQALFERYGVLRVKSLDELAFTLMMFAQPHAVATGGLATIHDSGGERALLIDLAADAGVRFAQLQPGTVARIAERLDPGLPAVNPLDAWGTGHGYDDVFSQCFSAMLQDPDTALGAIVCDRGPDGQVWPDYVPMLRAANRASAKPVFLVSNHQGSGHDPVAVSSTRDGLPVLDGVGQFLNGVKHLLSYRDWKRSQPPTPPELPADTLARWRERLARGPEVDEAEALACLADIGVPVTPAIVVDTSHAAAAAARELEFPVALKTAEPGILHKSRRGGVYFNLNDELSLKRAYRALACAIGPRVLVAPMCAEEGVEMILGVFRDSQFGAVLTLGAGGTQAELGRDVVFALPPFDADTAMALLERLSIWPLLSGDTSMPASDIAAYCDAAARLSVFAAELQPALAEVDINPLRVLTSGCIALDALMIAGRIAPAC